ncbi:MAG: redox-regulated ATPase YchF [Deltaproteobacteria bacterium]|uniref:Ribosome-binding ATPase YchF n=1 Tax=Candidatus Zymogenus saltonus TaxID=2844893 RepID=A0A9D8KIL4_9DELT|nr:redox-regulated ATPase YchF [Candidatus Zymogenus saltonus]
MGFNTGIIGLPNAGKSTIFNALTGAAAQTAGYPFTTIDPNSGIVTVPDERLNQIAEITKPKKITPTSMEFVDVAGLVKGASKGEGLGNQFLGHIRNLNAVIHVVRCFVDENVAHPEGDIDPGRDIGIIETELILADLAVVERRIEKVKKTAQSGDKEAKESLVVYESVKDILDSGRPTIDFLSKCEGGTDFTAAFTEMNLITAKPMLFVANIDENSLPDGNDHSRRVQEIAADGETTAVVISGKFEEEILSLDPDERDEYLKESGLAETGLSRIIKEGYRLLDLITFYTAVGPELRAWSIPRGTKASVAAGKIHTDMERGFIRAEVITFTDLEAIGSEEGVKEEGKIRTEGRDYIVEDGDIIRIKFNV